MFSKISRLALNIKKIYPFSTHIHTTEFEGIPVKEEVTYLGINILKILTIRSNFQALIPKVKNKFDRWLMRDLSLKGWVLLSKTDYPE